MFFDANKVGELFFDRELVSALARSPVCRKSKVEARRLSRCDPICRKHQLLTRLLMAFQERTNASNM